MPTRIAVVDEAAEQARERCPTVGEADSLLDWATDRANVLADWRSIAELARRELPPLCRDLLDIAIAVYISDIAVRRGERESWTREIELLVPVQEVSFWTEVEPKLRVLLYALTRDNWRLDFYDRPSGPERTTDQVTERAVSGADCVSLLSGGLDSLAGAVMLQNAGRRPLYTLHRSGNPTVRRAQQHVIELIARKWPGESGAASITVAPRARGETALPFVPPEEREPSQRTRSLLYMTLGVAAAVARGVAEVYMCENGVLTAGLPMSPSRAGSMSTRSTHPVPMAMFNELCEQADLAPRVTNPFIYQTKADLIRDILKPALSPAEIQATVSCWATGRKPRQCGGCIPCLLRRIGMLHAGLPDEAYMMDLLADPHRYAGTDAYGNLVDLLRQAEQMLTLSDVAIVVAQPELLELQAAGGVSIQEMIVTLRRHAQQVRDVMREHFPQCTALMSA